MRDQEPSSGSYPSEVRALIGRKTRLLTSLGELRRQGAPEAARGGYKQVADIEIEIARRLSEAGLLHDAAINLFSAASCYSEARLFSSARDSFTEYLKLVGEDVEAESFLKKLRGRTDKEYVEESGLLNHRVHWSIHASSGREGDFEVDNRVEKVILRPVEVLPETITISEIEKERFTQLREAADPERGFSPYWKLDQHSGWDGKYSVRYFQEMPEFRISHNPQSIDQSYAFQFKALFEPPLPEGARVTVSYGYKVPHLFYLYKRASPTPDLPDRVLMQARGGCQRVHLELKFDAIYGVCPRLVVDGERSGEAVLPKLESMSADGKVRWVADIAEPFPQHRYGFEWDLPG